MGPSIDRGSPLPFYWQLKEILLHRIQDAGLVAGDRLPGDHELCATYDVSRSVVRQALTELEAEGVIERVKGRGTFVAQAKTPEGLVQSLTGLYEDVAARGGHLRSQVRRLEVVPADAQVAADLAVAVGTRVILIDRLRFVDGEPWVLTVTHVPYELAPGLLGEDLTDASLYALLEGSYGVTLTSGRRSVEAAVANRSLAQSLGVARGAPILVLRSVGFGPDGRPVETFVAHHRGDRSRFEVELTRRSPAGRPLMTHVR
jgi:GntR family transcriptional regulator